MIQSEIKALEVINNAFRNSNYDIFLVGGCVRDLLMRRTPKDWDLTTPATPDEIIDICIKNNIKYIETGIKYGTITLIVEDIPFEVTTFRKDVY